MVDIFITSWYRVDMTLKTVSLIHQRTSSGSFALHVFDNGSDISTQESLVKLLKDGRIASLHLDSRNTGCLYNKGIYHMMVESTKKYYCVSDNDVFPPKLTPDWLSRMVLIMESHPKLALLAMQVPPQRLQDPTGRYDMDIVYCTAVGNTFKMVRREAFPQGSFEPKIMQYGDDGLLSMKLRESRWDIAFCRDIWCYHAGQCKNWGYRDEEIAKDPRKAGYGKPFEYEFEDEEKYLPKKQWRLKFVDQH